MHTKSVLYIPNEGLKKIMCVSFEVLYYTVLDGKNECVFIYYTKNLLIVCHNVHL